MEFITLLNALDDLVAVVDFDGIIKECNKAFVNALLLTHEDVLYTKISKYFPEKYIASSKDKICAMYGQILNKSRIPLKNVKDEIKFYEARVSKFNYEGTEAVIVVLRDIEDILETEKQLLHSKGNYMAILDNIPYIAWLKSLDGVILSVNEPYAKALGLEKDDVLGKSDYDLWPREIADVYAKDEKQLIDTKETIYKEEKIVDPKYGSHSWVETFRAIVKDENNIPIATIGLVRDITEKKNLENKVIEAVKAKEEFLAVASHDLKNPLANIKTSAAMLLENVLGELPDSIREIVKIIDDQAFKGINLISDLLDIDKLESGRLELHKTFFEANQLLENIEKTFGIIFKTRNIEFNVISRIPTHFTLNADFRRICQVLDNVISNALKYVEDEEGVINIILDEKDEHLIIQIENNGPPIPETHLTKIFKKYEQVSKSDKSRGNGLGLAICSMICSLHEGSIYAIPETTFPIKENEKIGVSFIITLPKAKI